MANYFDTVTLDPADTAGVRIVQLTDCHILAGDGERLRGVDTRRSFEAVLAAALRDNSRIDLILATGDLAEDGSAEAYRYLAASFTAAGLPTFWLPGNHDDPATMRTHLAGAAMRDARLVLSGNWLILMLDSTLAGQVRGRVAEAELDFMDGALRRHADRHALVCLHHQALEADSEWIDAKGLENSAQLRDRLTAHANVRGVLWGHVHQELYRHRDGIEWMSTPSTCVQFMPGSREFAVDDQPPGYRYLVLGEDGAIETGVRRLPPV
ncbi:MAG TPA: 3',5'-cyclic-AMP phosphodiesterase [Gammaproteobacteria bacterium]